MGVCSFNTTRFLEARRTHGMSRAFLLFSSLSLFFLFLSPSCIDRPLFRRTSQLNALRTRVGLLPPASHCHVPSSLFLSPSLFFLLDSTRIVNEPPLDSGNLKTGRNFWRKVVEKGREERRDEEETIALLARERERGQREKERRHEIVARMYRVT